MLHHLNSSFQAVFKVSQLPVSPKCTPNLESQRIAEDISPEIILRADLRQCVGGEAVCDFHFLCSLPAF